MTLLPIIYKRYIQNIKYLPYNMPGHPDEFVDQMDNLILDIFAYDTPLLMYQPVKMSF